MRAAVIGGGLVGLTTSVRRRFERADHSRLILPVIERHTSEEDRA